MTTDAELLHRYVAQRDERAFAEIVHRHLDLVYAAAHRRTGGRAHLAEEIAQAVFTDLARKAPTLSRHSALTGWLYRSTRYATIDAIRRESRRQNFTKSLTAMIASDSSTGDFIEWERLRPLIDQALDQLKESDREIMLLRFFKGHTFAEVGSSLNVSENAARMRAERALDRLRVHLGRRGVTSTTSALGLLLANQVFAATPAGLAATVTTAAVTTVPVGASVISLLIMNKIGAPVLTAMLAAGVTILVWTAVVPRVTAGELSGLRAENLRLNQAVVSQWSGPTNSSRNASSAGKQTLTATLDNSGAAIAAGDAAAQKKPGGSIHPEVTARGHYDHGISTPHDAVMTFAWAGDVSDPDEFAKIITFDPDVRLKAATILASMPDAIRSKYPTPEAFYGLLLAASTLESPPPGADVIENLMKEVEIQPGRIGLRRIGATRNNGEYQSTSEGWKYVLPLAGVEGLPGLLKSPALAQIRNR
ncbi:MAG TPA: sigma-70 family RNA polymerase sigma factor [Lacunisphaera sp.]|jgi:RNA polymerase sigma factor (sigma-70 family)